MATFAPHSQAFTSPKRKRSAELANLNTQPPASLPRLSTESDAHHAGVSSDTGSPRSAVAGHLEQLEIQDPWVQHLPFQEPGAQRKRFAHMSPEPAPQQSHITAGQQEPRQPNSLVHGPSPLVNESLNRSPTNDAPDLSASGIISRPHARPRSPLFDGDPKDNPLTWHESEITGHNPTDPSDDGYGINGIGFKPTPAMAYARSQKRKQQMAEYRSREAKEARQRRSERRRVLSGDNLGGMDELGKSSKVRFA